jgi:hypothetical protein
MASCGAAEYATRIEVLHPAKNPVPYAGKTLAIFNALHVTHEEEDGTVTYATDSVMANLLAEGAKEALEESPLFDDYDIPLFNLTLFCHDSCPELHDTAYMASLSEQSQASLLLIIDHAATGLQKRAGTQGNDLHITYSAAYRFYDAEQHLYVATRLLHDSLTYSNRLLGDLSDEGIQELWRDIIRDTGRQALESTVPQWTTNYRRYYVPSFAESPWISAANYAYQGRWAEAMKIWGELASAATGKKAAYAAFNMATGAEMTGEYELALEWLDLVGKNIPPGKTDNYRKQIRQRMADREKLNEQLGY